MHHKVFRNTMAVQTHPKDRQTACQLVRSLEIPRGQQTHLNMRVSHHPHGDWQLRVLVNDDVLVDKIVDAKAVSEEWLDLDVDLSQYAGKQVQVAIENKANNWSNEWAYWNYIKIVSE